MLTLTKSSVYGHGLALCLCANAKMLTVHHSVRTRIKLCALTRTCTHTYATNFANNEHRPSILLSTSTIRVYKKISSSLPQTSPRSGLKSRITIGTWPARPREPHWNSPKDLKNTCKWFSSRVLEIRRNGSYLLLICLGPVDRCPWVMTERSREYWLSSKD